MRKIKILFLLLMTTLVFVGCAKSNIEVFRFINHEGVVEKGKQITLELIYGEYPEDSVVTYSLSESGIISLEGNVATGVKVGEVTVTATIDGEKFANMVVKVIDEPITFMQINLPGGKDSFLVNDTLNFADINVTVNPSTQSNDVIWSVVDNSSALKLTYETPNDPTSKLIKLEVIKGPQTLQEYNAGGLKVTLVAQSTVDPIMSVKKEITINYKKTSTFTLNAQDNKTSINLGESVQLQKTIQPANACPIVSFTSSDPTLLLVDANGLVTTPEGSTKYGKATITGRTFDGFIATVEITVVDPNPQP